MSAITQVFGIYLNEISGRKVSLDQGRRSVNGPTALSAFRTDDEFYHVYNLPADFQRYESWPLHQALDYFTRDQFYQQWLS